MAAAVGGGVVNSASVDFDTADFDTADFDTAESGTAESGTVNCDFDFDTTYTMPADLRIVRRGETALQIGTEPPRRLLLLDAPDRAAEVLTCLNGVMSAGEAVARSADGRGVWQPLLGELIAAGMLVRAQRTRPAVPAYLCGEQLSLIHRYGTATADRLLAARADAVVLIEGDGPVADATAAILAGCGVGHVHRDAPGAAKALNGSQPDPPPGSGPNTSSPAGGRPRPDGLRQAPAWAASPNVRVYRPAPQIPPSMVVLASRTPPDLGRAAQLVTSLVPHLAVWVSQARVIVGPLVLPGRSPCLNCLDRDRSDSDDGWSDVARSLRHHAITPGALATQVAAELAAGQVLDLLDGQHAPDTVGATIERPLGSAQVTRRRWESHPDCGCRLLSGQL